jgi:RimJ/RimL family protein N-acetyltransferase
MSTSLGQLLPDWHGATRPAREILPGRYCRLEPLDCARHADSLIAAQALDRDGRNWDYLPYGPFATTEAHRDWLITMSASTDPFFYAIVDAVSGDAVGVAAYMRIDPANGVVEVGHLNFSPRLQRTPAATEAMHLMMANAFARGFRRYEWKCNSLNAPSRTTAQRLGFSFEGVFRQVAVVKGRNRDTAWYSVIDSEWPAIAAAHQTWLAADNFDAQGQQRQRLTDLTLPLLANRG